jgi:hypothetical protein
MLNYYNEFLKYMSPSKTRKIDTAELKKLQKDEKIRNDARRTGQKKGVSISTDKPKLKTEKVDRPARKTTKKRVAVR